MKTQSAILPLPMSETDLRTAKSVAAALGFGDSTAYTSSSDITGLYCLATRAGQREGVIIKTEAFGICFLATLEDMGLSHLA